MTNGVILDTLLQTGGIKAVHRIINVHESWSLLYLAALQLTVTWRMESHQ